MRRTVAGAPTGSLRARKDAHNKNKRQAGRLAKPSLTWREVGPPARSAQCPCARRRIKPSPQPDAQDGQPRDLRFPQRLDEADALRARPDEECRADHHEHGQNAREERYPPQESYDLLLLGVEKAHGVNACIGSAHLLDESDCVVIFARQIRNRA